MKRLFSYICAGAPFAIVMIGWRINGGDDWAKGALSALLVLFPMFFEVKFREK